MTSPRRSAHAGHERAHDVAVASTISSRTRSGLRRRNWIAATRVAQSQTGENTFAMRGARIGLGSIFSPCVTAKAAAVPPSNATTSRVESNAGHAPRF